MMGAGSGEPGAGRTREPHPHERLDAWREGIELVKAIYEVSATMPASERYGLVSQLNRAAVSVPANMA